MLARESRLTLVVSIASGIVSGLSSVILISQINRLIPGSASGDTSKEVSLFILLLLVVLASGAASQITLLRLGQKSMLTIRMAIVRQILSTPYQKLESIGSTKLYASLTEDVGSLVNATQALPYLAINGAILVAGFAYLAWLSFAIFFFSILFVLSGAFIFKKISAQAKHHMERGRELTNILFGHFHAAIYGAKELKLNRIRREEFYEDDVMRTAESFRESNVRGLAAYALANQWSTFLLFSFLGILIFGRAALHLVDDQVLLKACITGLYVMGPIAAVLNLFPILGRAGVAARQIDSLQLSPVPASTEYAVRTGCTQSPDALRIELVEASYRYRSAPDDRFALGPISMELRSREVVYLIGGNGSGKSTLLKMITGLYQPDSGSILVNGKTVGTEEKLDAYRQNFSAVFSDFYLFNRIPSDRAATAGQDAQLNLEMLQLSDKVSLTNGQFSTTALSQGQRKRLALLSAFLEDRPVYVFDEWAAEQDPIFRELFYTQLVPQLKQRGKAVLIASHDDRYFGLADRIIELELGRIRT
jgi:putative ATP-binding cassette transporter